MNKAERQRIVWEKTHGRCWYCGWHFDEMCIDHVVPRSLGGGNEIDNLVPCCRPCNSSKRDRSVEYLRSMFEHAIAGAPRFTQAQIDYLRRYGIEVPALPRHVFYFERMQMKDADA
jgi:5-methylcytosine-specific restriction endonuclease McrA